jgi:hypothetical protein
MGNITREGILKVLAQAAGLNRWDRPQVVKRTAVGSPWAAVLSSAGRVKLIPASSINDGPFLFLEKETNLDKRFNQGSYIHKYI